MNKKIAVCNHCGEPLISTFAFIGAEYYCLMCGATYGMFSVETVESTKELKYTQKLYEKLFKVIYKDMIPAGAYLNKCEKCKQINEPHIYHATETELLKNEIAIKTLERLKSGKYD